MVAVAVGVLTSGRLLLLQTIYTNKKHIDIVSKYLDKARCNKKVLSNLVNEDKKFPPQ
jgi:hypothetical protein